MTPPPHCESVNRFRFTDSGGVLSPDLKDSDSSRWRRMRSMKEVLGRKILWSMRKKEDGGGLRRRIDVEE